MRYSVYIPIILTLSIFSCDNNYHFDKIQNTNSLIFRAGPVEGVVLQNKKDGNIIFSEADFPILERYIRKMELIISHFFYIDEKDNSAMYGINLVKNDSLKSEEIVKFMRANVRKIISNTRLLEIEDNKSNEERKTVLWNEIKENLQSLKRIYEIELSDSKQGGAFCYMFFSNDKNEWAINKIPFNLSLKEEPRGIIFFFEIKGENINIRDITFD
jgi:hypothetical protein